MDQLAFEILDDFEPISPPSLPALPFDPSPTTSPTILRGATLAERFDAFHRANPHVYRNLTALALQAVRTGRKKLGIAQLFEVLRWKVALVTKGDDFKLNNDYRAMYARLMMEREPELDGVFETREQKAV